MQAFKHSSIEVTFAAPLSLNCPLRKGDVVGSPGEVGYGTMAQFFSHKLGLAVLEIENPMHMDGWRDDLQADMQLFIPGAEIVAPGNWEPLATTTKLRLLTFEAALLTIVG